MIDVSSSLLQSTCQGGPGMGQCSFQGLELVFAVQDCFFRLGSEYLQCFSQIKEEKKKKKKRKERKCFDEVKAQNKPGSLMALPRFAEN